MRKRLRIMALSLTAILFSIVSQAQDIPVNGRVTSTATGEVVVGASVKVKGGSIGTETDATGRVHLTVPSLPVTLLISSVGYEPQEIDVTSSAPLIVNFNPTS